MKKIHLLWLALVAVFALGAFVASSASANEFLVEKLAVPATGVPAETEGELELLRYANGSATLILTVALCSGIFDGLILPKEAEVEDLLTLDSLTTIGTLDPADENKTALKCEVTHDDEELTDCKLGEAKVTVDALNLQLKEVWKLVLTLLTVTEWDLTFPLEAGWEVECQTLIGITGSELCLGGAFAEALAFNVTTTAPPSVGGEFMTLAQNERGTCTEEGGAEQKEVSEVNGAGNTWAIGAELVRLEIALS